MGKIHLIWQIFIFSSLSLDPFLLWFFFSFSVQSISLLYGQPLPPLLPPLHSSPLPPPLCSSISCSPSTTLTSLPGKQSTTLVFGASVKAWRRNNLTATAPIPSLVCPLSLAFIFWLYLIFSCICRNYFCLPTIFQVILRFLMITFSMTFHLFPSLLYKLYFKLSLSLSLLVWLSWRRQVKFSFQKWRINLHKNVCLSVSLPSIFAVFQIKRTLFYLFLSKDRLYTFDGLSCQKIVQYSHGVAQAI